MLTYAPVAMRGAEYDLVRIGACRGQFSLRSGKAKKLAFRIVQARHNAAIRAKNLGGIMGRDARDQRGQTRRIVMFRHVGVESPWRMALRDDGLQPGIPIIGDLLRIFMKHSLIVNHARRDFGELYGMKSLTAQKIVPRPSKPAVQAAVEETDYPKIIVSKSHA